MTACFSLITLSLTGLLVNKELSAFREDTGAR